MPPPSSNARIVLIGLVSLVLTMGVGRFAFTPLLPMMRTDGLIDVAGGGLLASVHFVGYWIGAVVALKVPCSPRTTLRLALAVTGLGTLAMGLTAGPLAWAALRFVCGVASAWALVLVSHFYIKALAETGTAQDQGWVFSGVGLGICLTGLGCLALMAGGADSMLGWQVLGWVTLAAGSVLCFAVGPEIPAVRPAAEARTKSRSPLDWPAVIAYGAMGVGYIIPATYLPVMARDIVPSPLVFGWAWPIFGAAAFLSTALAAGWLGRVSNRRMWAGSQMVMAAGLLMPVVYPGLAAIVIAGVGVGGTFMVITMAGMKEAHRAAPPDDVMRHIAVLTAAFASGQIIGPVFASTLHTVSGNFTGALVAASAVLAATSLGLARHRLSAKAIPANRASDGGPGGNPVAGQRRRGKA